MNYSLKEDTIYTSNRIMNTLEKETDSSNAKKLLSLPVIKHKPTKNCSVLETPLVQMKKANEDLTEAVYGNRVTSICMVEIGSEWDHLAVEYHPGDTLMSEYDKPKGILIEENNILANVECLLDTSDNSSSNSLDEVDGYQKLVPEKMEIQIKTDPNETVSYIETIPEIAFVECKVKHDVDLKVEDQEQDKVSMSPEHCNQEVNIACKKYKYHVCGHETSQKDDLNRHLLWHQYPEEVNLFRCDQCDFKTILKEKIPKNKSSEEQRRRKTELQRLRRMKLRNNPEEYEKVKAHERDRWKKRQEQGKIKKN